jgi:hypothetical protein
MPKTEATFKTMCIHISFWWSDRDNERENKVMKHRTKRERKKKKPKLFFLIWINGWMYRLQRQIYSHIYTYRQIDWTGGFVDGWVDRWMDG